jgi:hypothetical protein
MGLAAPEVFDAGLQPLGLGGHTEIDILLEILW